MKWRGKELNTYGDVGDMVLTILRGEEDPGEAKRFMEAYLAENVHAYANVGYLSGYYDPETMRAIWQKFEVAHPIFGTSTPTSEQAFEAGKKMAQQ